MEMEEWKNLGAMGQRLSALRAGRTTETGKRLSQQAVAKGTGIDRSRLSMLETGKAFPKTFEVEWFATFYGVEALALLEGIDAPEEVTNEMVSIAASREAQLHAEAQLAEAKAVLAERVNRIAGLEAALKEAKLETREVIRERNQERLDHEAIVAEKTASLDAHKQALSECHAIILSQRETEAALRHELANPKFSFGSAVAGALVAAIASD